MKRHLVARSALAAAGALALAAATAGAHPSDTFIDDGFLNSALDEHQTYGHGAEGSVPGRLELPSGAREVGLKLIGKTVNAPEFGDLGRVADVSAKGNYAYLTDVLRAARAAAAACRSSTSPTRRTRQDVGYVPSHVDTFSRRGLAGRDDEHAVVQGRPARLPERVVPGHDQRRRRHHRSSTSPTRDRPKKLVEGAGDFTKKDGSQSGGVPQTKANQTHSAFAWQRPAATAAGTSCWSTTWRRLDVDILDITNPSQAEARRRDGTSTQTAQAGPGRPHGDAVFSHDMVVKKIGGKRRDADVLLGRRLRHSST